MWEKLLGIAFALLALMLVGLTLLLAIGLGGYLWDEQRLTVVLVACSAATVGAFVLRKRPRPPGHETDGRARVHPGISMHSIPIGRGIGIVFAMGYIVMFWFGAPGYRPIVLGAAVLGGLLGALLIWRRRSGSDRGDTSMLHLESQAEAISEEARESRKKPDNNRMQLTAPLGAARG